MYKKNWLGFLLFPVSQFLGDLEGEGEECTYGGENLQNIQVVVHINIWNTVCEHVYNMCVVIMFVFLSLYFHRPQIQRKTTWGNS